MAVSSKRTIFMSVSFPGGNYVQFHLICHIATLR
jgi:hypothetical protein